MSRSSYTHRHRSTNSFNDKVSFVTTIIVGTVVYQHLQWLVRLEHQYIKVLPIITVVIGAALLLLLVKAKLHRKSVRFNRDMAEIGSMSGLEFEKYVADLLKQQGYTNIKLTEKFDYGVDIIAHKDGVRWGIQCKRYSGLVKKAAVAQVVAGLKYYNCDRAMVITNSTFSKQAKILARHNDCVLVGRRSYL